MAKDVLLGSFVTAVLSIFLCPLVIAFARRAGLTDAPGDRKIHHRPTPRLGGVAISFSFFVGMIILMTNLSLPVGLVHETRAFLIAATGMLLLGFYDDVFDTNAYQKILAQIAFGGILYSGGLRIEKLLFPMGHEIPLNWLGFLATVGWVVVVTNAVNLSDGLDTLCPLICLPILLVLAVTGFFTGKVFPASVAVILSAGLLGFLPYNFHPARIFLGDSGSMFLGVSIASISIWTASNEFGSINLLFPILCLVVPLFDTSLAIFRRLRSHRSIFVGDLDHIHHRLSLSGLSQLQVSIILHVITLMGCGVGVLLAAGNRVTQGIGLALIPVPIYILLAIYLSFDRKVQSPVLSKLLGVNFIRMILRRRSPDGPSLNGLILAQPSSDGGENSLIASPPAHHHGTARERP